MHTHIDKPSDYYSPCTVHVFLSNIPVLTAKRPYKDEYTYRSVLDEYREQLYHQTICTKVLKRKEKHKHVPGTFARWSPPLIDTAGGCPERIPQFPDRSELRRLKALKQAAIDTCPQGQAEASAMDASAGDASPDPGT